MGNSILWKTRDSLFHQTTLFHQTSFKIVPHGWNEYIIDINSVSGIANTDSPGKKIKEN